MKIINLHCHGDVGLIPVEELGLKINKDAQVVDRSPVLALGERSGHTHVLETDRVEWLFNAVEDINVAQKGVENFRTSGDLPDEHIFIRVGEDTNLRHLVNGQPTTEHNDVQIPQGDYKLMRPREHNHATISRRIYD